MYLVAGEEYSFEPQTQMFKKSLLESKKVCYLKHNDQKTEVIYNGELSFNKAPLFEVFRKIESFYHIHVICSAISSFIPTFTGRFKKDTPDEVIETIALLNDLEIKRVGDTVYLNKK